MTQANPSTLVERPTLTRILGISLRTLASLEAEHVIEPTERGKGRRGSTYALEQVIPAYIAHRERHSTGGERSARAARDEAQAELLRLRVDRERGALVPKDAITRAGCVVVETAKTRLQRVPGELRRRELVTADGEAAAEGLIRDVLEELSRLEVVA